VGRKMAPSFYDSDAALDQYLLFHYGRPEQICPLLPEARVACGFPSRCVTEPLRGLTPMKWGRALELASRFEEVVGIDFSARFVEAAQRMQTQREVTVRAAREGELVDELRLELPAGLRTGGVRFEQGDACALRADLGSFDLVLMANLIDRLPDPARCLARLPDLLEAGGALIITSPYTWLEEYTPRAKWIDGGGRGTLAGLRNSLAGAFRFRGAMDLPFLIREHRRKYQWSVAEASLWERI
jgi:putative 4-mercaptohistidine N1-methyltranferase